jgi:hypothetical protein
VGGARLTKDWSWGPKYPGAPPPPGRSPTFKKYKNERAVPKGYIYYGHVHFSFLNACDQYMYIICFNYNVVPGKAVRVLPGTFGPK